MDALLYDTIFMPVHSELGHNIQLEAWNIHGLEPEHDM